LAAWVGDYPEEVMIAHVSYGSCPIFEVPNGALMGYSTIRPLDNSRDQHIYSELLEDNHIEALRNLGVHPIPSQFWQYPLCNLYRLWQPDELHQLLLGLVGDLLHRLLKYLKGRNVKDRFDDRLKSVPWYPSLQQFSKSFDSLKSSTWQANAICGMIRTLAGNCAPILVFSVDDGKTGVSTASDEMVISAVRALCEFPLLVSKQNHSHLSLKALHDALKGLYLQNGILREKQMSKTAKPNVDDLLAKGSHPLREQKIHTIRASMDAVVYAAEKVSTTKGRQFQVRLNRARQAAMTWSDADSQNAIEWLDHNIHQVTPAKLKLSDKLFERHEPQLLQAVQTKATGPRSKFARDLAQMKAAAEDEAYSTAITTTHTRLQFQIRL
jgi:hypothetical protein